MKSIFSKAFGLLTLGCLLNMSVTADVSGATVALWTFEEGVPESTMVTDLAVPGALDSGVNGYDLYTDTLAHSPTFSPVGYGALGYGKAAYFDTADGSQFLWTTDSAIEAFSDDTWTIEFSFMLEDVGSWETIIGRDFSTTAASAMYIQRAGATVIYV